MKILIQVLMTLQIVVANAHYVAGIAKLLVGYPLGLVDITVHAKSVVTKMDPCEPTLTQFYAQFSTMVLHWQALQPAR